MLNHNPFDALFVGFILNPMCMELKDSRVLSTPQEIVEEYNGLPVGQYTAYPSIFA